MSVQDRPLPAGQGAAGNSMGSASSQSMARTLRVQDLPSLGCPFKTECQEGLECSAE